MNEIVQDLQRSFGRAFIDLANQSDIDVFIYTSYGSYSSPYGFNLLTEIGKKNIMYLPDYSVFDAIVALPNTFDIYGMDKEFFSLVKSEARCPIFCLQSGPEDLTVITVDNKNSIKALTNHMIRRHGFTRICYMSGPLTSKDSPDRLKGYMEAMEEAGLEVRPNCIYEGNYWLNRGKKAIDHFLAGGDEYPQAIVCANDYMAISICEELKARGKRVPEDVCVTGFDGVDPAYEYEPSLTTVVVESERYANKLFELINKAWEGETLQNKYTLSDKIVYSASCGCGAQAERLDYYKLFGKLTHNEVLLREAGRITADYQNDYDLDNALSVADFYFSRLDCDKGYLCLCKDEETQLERVENNTIFTDHMVLLKTMYMDNDRHEAKNNIEFDRRNLLPEHLLDTEKACTYITFPLNFKSKEYGFLTLVPEQGQWPNSITPTYINALSNAIESRYYDKLYVSLVEAKKMSKTDPLTHLNNRRGFEEELSNILASEHIGKTVTIVSIDMDGLKVINDNYGHADGDIAITTLAEILRTCVREGEICARFGGDEFMAILVSDEASRKEDFKEEFTRKLDETSNALGKPYRVGASIGMCDIEADKTEKVIECMQIADQRMYEDKRRRKANKAK